MKEHPSAAENEPTPVSRNGFYDRANVLHQLHLARTTKGTLPQKAEAEFVEGEHWAYATDDDLDAWVEGESNRLAGQVPDEDLLLQAIELRNKARNESGMEPTLYRMDVD